MNYYKPKFFRIEELVPEDFFYENKYRTDYLWAICFDPRILWTADRIRQRFGSMTVNTWLWPNIKKHEYRGYRPPSCKIGSSLSQHRYGRALDLVPQDVSAEIIRKTIKESPNHEDFQYITCIEDNTSWLHIDTRNWNKTENGILIITP